MIESGSNPNILNNPGVRIDFRRSMYIVGLMLRFFDFKNQEVKGDKLAVSCEPLYVFGSIPTMASIVSKSFFRTIFAKKFLKPYHTSCIPMIKILVCSLYDLLDQCAFVIMISCWEPN